MRSGDLGIRIVAAAAELLDETGNEALVTLRSIARRAGVSAPAIYGHFANTDSIFFAVLEETFAELEQSLRAGAAGAGSRPVARLTAVCDAYLDFAARLPQRYRIMFGGLWTATAALESSALSLQEVQALGQGALGVFVTALEDCVATGASTSTDVFADAVALWLGLHGLASQRSAAPAFPWPDDIAPRLITAVAHLAVH